MTAQAGAVAACPSCGAPCETEYDYNRKVNPTHLVAHRRYTPPAAVPVEALEGLVAKWREDAERMHAAAMRAQKVGNEEVSCSYLDAAKDARGYADELTQLIKERSNG